MTGLLSAISVAVSYGTTPALIDCSLQVSPGDRVALMGPSGSGKSTLLYALAGILRPDAGEVWFDGARLDDQRDAARSRLRLQRMGVVFQFGDLVPELTLEENVMLPLTLTGVSRSQARLRAVAALGRLGIENIAGQRAGTVSGGQAQRAAVARAVVHEPVVVLADEPTGSLDTVSSEAVLDVLVDVADEVGAALVVVTHDNQVAAHLDRLVTLRDGVVMTPAATRT